MTLTATMAQGMNGSYRGGSSNQIEYVLMPMRMSSSTFSIHSQTMLFIGFLPLVKGEQFTTLSAMLSVMNTSLESMDRATLVEQFITREPAFRGAPEAERARLRQLLMEDDGWSD